MNVMNEYLTTAIQAARAAAAIHRFHAEDIDKQIDTKANYADLVTKVDKESERRIRELISAAHPDHTILGEEQGELAGRAGHSRWRWIVDPLDGTLNYAHGFPFYCVSIALEVDGQVEVGVVLDSVRDELYTAVRGGGAFRNGSPIRVSSESRLSNALLSTGFASTEKNISDNLPLFGRALRSARAVRRAGAGALDLCLVACGRADGFWELTLNPWDVAAGVLILREAGGRVSDRLGGHYGIDNPLLVASNGSIHDELLATLAIPEI